MDKFNNKKKDNHWSKNIKWKFMPGAVCSACGQNNHEIYETGCPAMAIFCHCKAFYDKTNPKDLIPVLQQFSQYKAEQREKQKLKRREIKANIKQLIGCGDESLIKDAFESQYLEEFPEEVLVDNPLDQSDSDSQQEDM